MAIIASQLSDLTKHDRNGNTKLAVPTYPVPGEYNYVWNPTGMWWYKKPVDNRVPGMGGAGAFYYTYGAIDYTDNPNKNEFWLRFVWSADPARSVVGGDYQWMVGFELAYFSALIDGVLKPVSRIRHDSGTLYLDIFNPAVGTNTVAYTQVICTNCNSTISVVDPVTGLIMVDIRVKLDEVAGFIQAYDYNGTRKGEFLGRTTNSLKPTHIAIGVTRADGWGNPYGGWIAAPMYAIAADEPTFGMYVVSLSPKAEGSLQEQDVGTNGTGLFGRLRYPNVTSPVKITPAAGVTKQYTLTPENTTDLSMPANYVIKSVKLHGAYETVSTDNANVPISHLLKFKTGGELFSYPLDQPVVSNRNFQITNQLQCFGTPLNNNPKTGLAWTKEDLADIEYGFSVTGV